MLYCNPPDVHMTAVRQEKFKRAYRANVLALLLFLFVVILQLLACGALLALLGIEDAENNPIKHGIGVFKKGGLLLTVVVLIQAVVLCVLGVTMAYGLFRARNGRAFAIVLGVVGPYIPFAVVYCAFLVYYLVVGNDVKWMYPTISFVLSFISILAAVLVLRTTWRLKQFTKSRAKKTYDDVRDMEMFRM